MKLPAKLTGAIALALIACDRPAMDDRVVGANVFTARARLSTVPLS
jgi:hypothetical protein